MEILIVRLMKVYGYYYFFNSIFFFFFENVIQ